MFFDADPAPLLGTSGPLHGFPSDSTPQTSTPSEITPISGLLHVDNSRKAASGPIFDAETPRRRENQAENGSPICPETALTGSEEEASLTNLKGGDPKIGVIHMEETQKQASDVGRSPKTQNRMTRAETSALCGATPLPPGPAIPADLITHDPSTAPIPFGRFADLHAAALHALAAGRDPVTVVTRLRANLDDRVRLLHGMRAVTTRHTRHDVETTIQGPAPTGPVYHDEYRVTHLVMLAVLMMAELPDALDTESFIMASTLEGWRTEHDTLMRRLVQGQAHPGWLDHRAAAVEARWLALAERARVLGDRLEVVDGPGSSEARAAIVVADEAARVEAGRPTDLTEPVVGPDHPASLTWEVYQGLEDGRRLHLLDLSARWIRSRADADLEAYRQTWRQGGEVADRAA